MGKRSELPDVGSLLDAADPAPRLPKSPSGNNWLLPPSMQTAQAEAMANPPVVRQALVAAASRITTPDSFANPRQLIRVDGAPVIVHLLRGLQTSGIERAVITLGHAAQHIAEEVRKHAFGTMVVEFVWCEASSWKRGHASNILAARSMFAQVRAPARSLRRDGLASLCAGLVAPSARRLPSRPPRAAPPFALPPTADHPAAASRVLSRSLSHG